MRKMSYHTIFSIYDKFVHIFFNYCDDLHILFSYIIHYVIYLSIHI